ncbi:MAG: dihydroorotate dehydrogenase-like protein [Thiotrichales bacterium]
MIDFRTDYLGLTLKNPLVPSASPLSRGLDDARRLEDAGAAALVMYSLFEEEVRAEEALLDRHVVHETLGHAEAQGFMPLHPRYQSGLDAYLEQIVGLKSALEIPVVASLNGTTPGGWVELGRELAQAGADALELNVYYVAADAEQTSVEVERRYLELLHGLRQVVTLPIAIKLSPYFSSLPHFVQQLEYTGANGIALFNRFFQPDIDLDALALVDELQLSSSNDSLLTLRWIALLHGRTKLTLAATGGVHTSADALKMLLAGADVVHLASALIRHGPQRLATILREMEAWMSAREYTSVRQLKGSLSQRNQPDPAAYARASYVRLLDSFRRRPGGYR